MWQLLGILQLLIQIQIVMNFEKIYMHLNRFSMI
jgi:hypothetical protein